MKKLILLLFIPIVFTCSSDSSDGDSDNNNPCPNQPQLTTLEVSNIIYDENTDLVSATFSGEIQNIQLGANCETFSITNQGFAYSTNIQPTTSDNVVNANGENASANVSDLIPETTYYVRAYLTNTLGTFYGNEVSFTTPADPNNPLYLDTNGVTIKAKEWAEVGMTGVVDGITYTIVDREMLDVIIYEGFDLNNNQFINDVTKVCTSKITDMEFLFATYPFNQDISNWDVSNVDTMRGLFQMTPFNQDISNWDISNVTDMELMFASSIFNQDISNWDVSNVTDMSYMFTGIIEGFPFTGSAFNQDISNWDVSNVTEMNGMFSGNESFNQNIGNWDVSNVIDMSYMFQYSQFNQDIGNWNVSNVFNMERMFFSANYFNQDISNWDVGNVIDMSYMFDSTNSFNQPIGDWNVSNVTYCNSFCYNTPNWTLPKPDFTNCSDALGCD